MSFPSVGRAGVGGVDVAFAPTGGGADAPMPLLLLQLTVISATAARPAIAAWRYAIVLMGFLSRLPVAWVSLRLTSSPAGAVTNHLSGAGGRGLVAPTNLRRGDRR